MTAILLREADVEQLVDMRDTIDVVEQAFCRLADNTAENVPRTRVRAQGIVLHSMSAAAAYLGVVGWKQYTTTKSAARFHVGLYEQQSGQLLAIIEANRLGQLRTGAVTGVAAKWLAAPSAAEMGLIGTGWQAESQVQAIAEVRPLQRVRVFSRSEAKRRQFARQMSDRLQLSVVPVAEARDAVVDASIVVTATTSRDPVLSGTWLSRGTFVAAVGSNWRNKAEVDVATIQRASQVVCDSIECCQQEAGDLLPAIEAGVFQWSLASELADVVTGRGRKRSEEDDLVFFKSVGMAIEDVALGHCILERARQRGLGEALPF